MQVQSAQLAAVTCKNRLLKKIIISCFRLRPESTSEVEKVGEIVRGMGVEHQLLTLDWDTRPPAGKVQMWAREKRYGGLLEVCQERNIGVLMTGHHQDDQLGVCNKLCTRAGARVNTDYWKLLPIIK